MKFIDYLNKWMKTGVTLGNHDHFHRYKVDYEGNGETWKTIGNSEDHIHVIKKLKIMEISGHDHYFL